MSPPLFTRIDPELYVVAARHQGRDGMLLATWVAWLTLREDRGRVLVALSPGSLTAELACASRRLAVQLLAEGQDALIPRLGLVSGREQTNKLDAVEIERTRRGLPVVTGTCGWADCDVMIETVTGERVLLYARVIEEQVLAERRPLRLSAAYRALPKDVLHAIEEQRQRDGERDRP